MEMRYRNLMRKNYRKLLTEKTPIHYDDKIQEPDTDELLEQYGEEYDDDATLDSYHKVKPTSPIQPKTKKPVTVPAPPRRDSSETVDDALFLLDEGPTPGKTSGKQDNDYWRRYWTDYHSCSHFFHRTADAHGHQRF